ncbi:MAG: HAD family phosphatase [Trueperella sp.]|nr:HAD family phosphatase [Trueperella sp.]
MALADVYDAVGLPTPPAAVLWDMDGTILDTEVEWMRQSGEVVKSHGGIWNDELAESTYGVSSHSHYDQVMSQAILAGGGELVPGDELLFELGVRMARVYVNAELVPGAGALLGAFQAAGIPQALVTAAPGELLQCVRDSLKINYFDTMISGSAQIPGKPNPAPYLLAAMQLGVAAENCLAFEDSAPGIKSANYAGVHVVNVLAQPLVELAELL